MENNKMKQWEHEASRTKRGKARVGQVHVWVMFLFLNGC